MLNAKFIMFVYIRGGEGAKQRLTLYKVIVIVIVIVLFSPPRPPVLPLSRE